MSPRRREPEPLIAACPHCGGGIRADQDWCLECGAAATTRVLAPPGWKLPALVIGAVVLVFAVGLGIALLVLGGDANRSVADSPAPAQRVAVSNAKTPAQAGLKPASAPAKKSSEAKSTSGTSGTSGATATSAAAGTGTLDQWPAGKQAYSVIVLSTPDRSAAEKYAHDLIDKGTAPAAGVIDSSKYKYFSPGLWIVFAGQYDQKPQADAAAKDLKSKGQDGYATIVAPS